MFDVSSSKINNLQIKINKSNKLKSNQINKLQIWIKLIHNFIEILNIKLWYKSVG